MILITIACQQKRQEGLQTHVDPSSSQMVSESSVATRVAKRILPCDNLLKAIGTILRQV
jgi:hypothetical protein